jgi:hypothetical protein
MGTKRQRRPQTARVALAPALLEFFWSGDYAAPEAQAAGLCGKWGIVLDFTPSDCARIWREHREAVLAHWAATGVRGVPWAVRRYDRQESAATLPYPSPYAAFRQDPDRTPTEVSHE